MFDVDGCLLDSLTSSSLRPGARELLVHLRDRGCGVHLWSAGGAAYARARADEQGVTALFDGFHDKDARDDAGRYVPPPVTEAATTVFVDDRPEDMPEGADVVAVSPYLAHNPHDRGLAPAATRAGITVMSGL